MKKQQLEKLISAAGSRRALARQLTGSKKEENNLYRQIGLYLQGKRNLSDKGKYAAAFREANKRLEFTENAIKVSNQNKVIFSAGFNPDSNSFAVQYRGGYLEVSDDRRKRNTPSVLFSRKELIDFLALDAVEQREVFADKVGLPYFGYTDENGNDLNFNKGS